MIQYDFFKRSAWSNQCFGKDLKTYSEGYLDGDKKDAEKTCKVKKRGTNQLAKCEFPFKFKDKTHHGCIDYIDIKNSQKIPCEPW